MTRIEGGLVPHRALIAGDGAGAAGDAQRTAGGALATAATGGLVAMAATGGVGAAAAARSSDRTHHAVLLPWPRELWLITAGKGEVARPRAGYAPEATAGGGTASTSAAEARATVTSPLDFLRDSRLSAEEKLVLLLAQQQKDVEKEIDAVLKKAEAKSAQKTSGGSVLKKLNLMDVAKKMIPGLGLLDSALGSGAIAKAIVQLSGPVLAAGATAFGMPHLAPFALSAGPEILEAALEAGIPGTSAEAKASANAPNAGTGSSKALDPVETQRLTLLVNRQQQWAGMVSNLLHSQHQTRMNVIQNLR